MLFIKIGLEKRTGKAQSILDTLNAGMDAHVSKPLDVSVLERTVRSVLNGRFSGGTCTPLEDK